MNPFWIMSASTESVYHRLSISQGRKGSAFRWARSHMSLMNHADSGMHAGSLCHF